MPTSSTFACSWTFLKSKNFFIQTQILRIVEKLPGFYECITKLGPNLGTQDKILQELNLYKNVQVLFEMNMAKRQRNALSPGKNIR